MKNLTQERLREVLSYDPVTGIFTWIKPYHTNRKSPEAGGIDSSGYRQIRVDGRLYLAHRLAWLYQTGTWPGEIDHRNRIKLDNAFSNLREVSRCTNMQNVTSPNQRAGKLPGAYRKVTNAGTVRWQSAISAQGKQIHLGSFSTPSEASEAYLAAKRKYHK